MKIFGLEIRRKEKREVTIGPSTSVGLPWGGTSSSLFAANAMKLSAVYRCVDVRSDSIATMPQDVFVKKGGEWIKDDGNVAHSLLNVQPNPSCSSFTFRKTLMAMVDLNGNGYARIHRDYVGNPVKLELLTGSITMYMKPDLSVYYEYLDGYAGSITLIDGDDMIHVTNFSYDGLLGVSVLTHAANITGLAASADGQAKGFYSSGANLSGIISVPGKIDSDRAKALKDSWGAAFTLNSNTGVAGGVAVMEGGAEYKSVQVNPKDAQMLETRAFNVLDICRFFGVSPIKAFDISTSTYANVESYQLGYITDTITPISRKIENEFNRKLFRPSQRNKTKIILDINELMSADLDTQANYYSQMLQCGAFTPNEIRRKIHNPVIKDGDTSYIQVNLAPVGQKPESEQNKNTGVKIDNDDKVSTT